MLRNVVLAAAFFSLTGFSWAQPVTRQNFNRSSDYDVQHYVLRVSFDRAKKQVIGDSTVVFKPLRDNFKQVTLDSVDISYSTVKLENTGAPLKFRTQAGQVIVDLDRAYNTGEQVALRFAYTTIPKKGVYFVGEQKAADGVPARSSQIWTQGEPDEARHWFPSFDFPSDKATVEEFITARPEEKVVGNGYLVEKLENADGTVTHHFKMDIPFSTYLVSFVVGEYAVVQDKYRDISLGYYVYPGTESVVPKAFGRTKDMIQAFEELTKVDFPFAKYDQTVVASFQFGGMENITATTMSDRDIFLVNNELFAATVEDLVSHELAHSWFGDLVTCRNWAELWLNEGFATFMEAAFREKKYGRQSYILKVMSDAEQFIASDAVNSKRHGLFNQNAANVNALFDIPFTTYNKGGAVLHTLREQVGDEAFWRGVNLYLTRHRLGNVESTDLRKAMEEASGYDLGWFFDQWVYGTGSPQITVRQAYSPATRTATLTFTQTQKADRLTPAVFRLPLELGFTTSRGTVTETVELTKRVQVVRVKTNAPYTKVEIDKAEKVPIKSIRLMPPVKNR